MGAYVQGSACYPNFTIYPILPFAIAVLSDFDPICYRNKSKKGMAYDILLHLLLL